MSDVNDLVTRIEGAFSSVKEKLKRQQQEQLQAHLDRQRLLKLYEKAQARVVEIARPRLEALAKRAGERVKVTPSVSQTRRQATFEFRSDKAHITLTFSVTPDMAVENVVVEFDLRVVPVLWKFDSHAEFSTPIDAVDEAGLTKWLDDRIVGVVELYIQIHEGEIYDKAEYVEDPVANVKFPKFAAGATLELDGKTYFFIDEKTRAEFAGQKKLGAV
jgi:YHS domain-containing protein